jgi:centromere protein B
MTQKGIKRKALSLKEKLRVIREVESNPTLTRVEVAKRLNMPVTTVKGIMRKKAFNKLSLLISLLT